MKKLLIIFSCFYISLSCLGQDLTQYYQDKSRLCGGVDSLRNKKGIWQKTSDDIVFADKTYPRNQHKLVTGRIDSLFSIIRQAVPKLDGIEPRWHRSIRGDAYNDNGPVPYSFESLYFNYYCNVNESKIDLGDETGTTIKVFVNKLNWFFNEVESWDISNDGKMRRIYQLPPKSERWNDVIVYEPKISSNTISRTIIIGRNEKLPWRSLTESQYLTGLKNKFEADLKKTKPGSGFERNNKEKLQYINDYLAGTPEDQLQQPAIIDPRAGIWGFKGKFGDEDKDGFRLVVLVLSNQYFNPVLPRHVPQLIQLYWSHTQFPTCVNLIKQFEENFQIEKLKDLIDK